MSTASVIAAILVAVVTLATVSAAPARYYHYDIPVDANQTSPREVLDANTASEVTVHLLSSASSVLVGIGVRSNVTEPAKEKVAPPAENVLTSAGDANGGDNAAEAAVAPPATPQEALAMTPIIQEAANQLNAPMDITEAQNVSSPVVSLAAGDATGQSKAADAVVVPAVGNPVRHQGAPALPQEAGNQPTASKGAPGGGPTPQTLRLRGSTSGGWWAPSTRSPWSAPSTDGSWVPRPSWDDSDDSSWSWSSGGSSDYSWDLRGGSINTSFAILLGIFLVILAVFFCLRWAATG